METVDIAVVNSAQRAWRAWRRLDPQTRLALIYSALATLLFMAYAALSTGVYQDDDIAHFLFARFSWRHPSLALDPWGRPAFTVLYAPAAALGLTAVRLQSAVLAGAVCLMTARLADIVGVRRYALAALLVALQPEFFRQAFSALTELTYAALLCAALIALRRRHTLLAALAIGLMPVARYESLPVVLWLALCLVRAGGWRHLAVTAVPLAVQNGTMALTSGRWTDLLFPISKALGLSGAAAVAYDYPPGSPWHYTALAPAAWGGAVFVLFVYGALRWRVTIEHGVVGLTLLTLGLTQWLLPDAGVAGFARHLAMVAPVVAVVGAQGLERLAQPCTARWRHNVVVFACAVLALRLYDRHMLGAAGVAGVAGVLTGVFTGGLTGGLGAARWVGAAHYMRMATRWAVIGLLAVSSLTQIAPWRLTGEQRLVRDAAEFVTAHRQVGAPVIASHPWLAFSTDLDWWSPAEMRPLSAETVASARPGSLVVWDAHYSGRLSYRVPLSTLACDRRLLALGRWTGGADDYPANDPPFELVVFRVIR